MNYAKLKTLGLSCVYFLFVTFSASVNAAILDQEGTGVSVEGWSDVGGQELPILNFDETRQVDNLLEDIRAENITVDKDGSTHFQLSHSGPMSRQVFANVRRVEQSDGFTRHVITNIADGHQTEYLTRTARVGLKDKHGKYGDYDYGVMFLAWLLLKRLVQCQPAWPIINAG
jgi:hypothetical protein